MHVGPPAVAAVWLAPPSPWRWPPQPEPAGGGPHSLETLFLPPDGGRGGLHWVRHGMLAFAAVTAAGELRVRLRPPSLPLRLTE